jgi:hypothetical protein
MVGTFWPDNLADTRRCGRKMERWYAWISAILPQVDYRLGASLPEDGNILVPETLCRQDKN